MIDATADVFNYTLNEVDLSENMANRLKNDIHVFSALKTNAQLRDAAALLLDENKKIKPFYKFSKDITSIKKNYNQNYLRSEYEFAVGSTQMAERWEQFKGDRYNLQYRTAADDKVRASHEILHNTTLPKSDPFWDQFFPPNGWRCRCTTVQVLKQKYPENDSKESIKKGKKATTQIGKNGKNKLEIFRFNPGKKQVVFPPDHPYKKVKGAEVVKKQFNKKHVDLNKFIKGTEPTNNEVKTILKEYAKLNSEDFRNGLDHVKVSKARSYMMQHSMSYSPSTGKWVNGSTISLSGHTFSSNGVNPLSNFKSALGKIKNGKALTFNEEYSIESMWHEILHAKTKSAPQSLSSVGVKNMETINQFCARHTYDQFLEKLGGKAIHQEDIIKNGYGYSTWVTNFREQLKTKNIDEKTAVKELMPHLLNDYKSIGAKVNEYLNKSTKQD